MSELGEKHIDKHRSFHIGKRIKVVFDESGLSVVELAHRLHRERSTVYSIFERSSIDVELLVSVSEALNHNFLEDVNAHFGLPSSGAGLSINLSVNALDIGQMEHLLALLNELKDQTYLPCGDKTTEL